MPATGIPMTGLERTKNTRVTGRLRFRGRT
nr:MAG TPA: hypothetical protein [Caudoviricetes sp.]